MAPRWMCRTRPCFNPRAARRTNKHSPTVSIHAPRAGRDDAPQFNGSCHLFQSTRPARGATRQLIRGQLRDLVSIHAPRAGRDLARPHHPRIETVFQSTRPARGATVQVCGEPGAKSVSIHAPRAGRDADARGVGAVVRRFNSRAPRGARPGQRFTVDFGFEFQSTRPARGATDVGGYNESAKRFQSTRPARGATTLPDGSTHVFLFQSTRPARGATPQALAGAPVRGSFNPRAPRGARRLKHWLEHLYAEVSIHAPRAGRDPKDAPDLVHPPEVSIHAPRAGRDGPALSH